MRKIATRNRLTSACVTGNRLLHALTLILTATAGAHCNAPSENVRESSNEAGAVVTSAGLLSRITETHRRATSLRAIGLIRDMRRGGRELPVSWHLARPDRCRLQIDMDVAIVLGEQWWTYRPSVGRFTSHRPFTKTPVETAATLISDGVPFLLPQLFNQGPSALGAGADGLYPEWRLKGAAFMSGTPCYLFERHEPKPGERGFLRILVDQKTLLLRGWTLGRERDDGTEKVLIDVSYFEMTANEPISREDFEVSLPQAILLPAELDGGERR